MLYLLREIPKFYTRLTKNTTIDFSNTKSQHGEITLPRMSPGFRHDSTTQGESTPCEIKTLDVELFFVADVADMLRLVVAHNVHETQVVSREEQRVEVAPVHLAATRSCQRRVHETRQDLTRLLHPANTQCQISEHPV